MKKQDLLKPLVITAHPMLYVCAAFFLMFVPFMLWAAFSQTDFSDRLLCLFVSLGYTGLGTAFLLAPHARKITVSTQGVTIDSKRGSIHIELPWKNYRFLYTLSGYKVCYLLFSPVALTKQEQYDACQACRRSKDVPFVHEGCLALLGVVTMYTQQILQRLPDSIRVMPEHECGTLWNKGKGL